MPNISDHFRNWVAYSTFINVRRWKNVPGAVVEGASKDMREILKTLKSSDIGAHTNFKEYWEMFSSQEWETKKVFKKLLLDFDKKIIK
jgi:hypothetical protein